MLHLGSVSWHSAKYLKSIQDHPMAIIPSFVFTVLIVGYISPENE